MFSAELKKLIEASLVDGVLTDNERAAIIKRAIIEGNDPAEVNILLDAELQQLRNKTQASAPKVRKCPACGEILPPLTGICPTCGYTVPVQAAAGGNTQDLETLINQINRALAQLKSGTGNDAPTLATIEELRRKALTLYGENQKVQMVIADIDKEVAAYKKGAWKRSLGKKKGCIIAIIVAIIFLVIGAIANSKDEEKADAQFKELVEKLDKMKKDSITNDNIDQKQADLKDLIWIDSDATILSYERKKKEAFEQLKENYQEKLDEFRTKNRAKDIDEVIDEEPDDEDYDE